MFKEYDDDWEDINHDEEDDDDDDSRVVVVECVSLMNVKPDKTNKPSNFAATKAIPGSDIASAKIWS